jgi:hypothetical protein
MSDLSEQGQSAPRDPLNYAPPRLREKRESRSIFSSELSAGRDTGLEPTGRAVARPPSLDWQLEKAVFESLRHSLDPEVMPEPPAVGRGRDWRSIARFASRLALAVGVSAVAALVIVIMVARQPNSGGSSLASTLASSTAAVPHPNQAEDESKPALDEFKGLLATTGEATRSAAPHESDQLLQQFLVWREKANPNDPPR